MERLFYPAVFHKAEEGGFWVSFPDIPECMTQGDDMQDAYEMAVDALGLSLSTMEDAGEVIGVAEAAFLGNLLDRPPLGEHVLGLIQPVFHQVIIR